MPRADDRYRQFATEADADDFAEAMFVRLCRRMSAIEGRTIRPADVHAGTDGWERDSRTGALVLPQKTVRVYQPFVAADGTAVILRKTQYEPEDDVSTERVGGRDVSVDTRESTTVLRSELTAAQEQALIDYEAGALVTPLERLRR